MPTSLSPELVCWITGNDTGMSSKAIFRHMTTGNCDGSYPYDPDDLGRCLRLLDLAPEWEARMSEMRAYGKEWAALSVRWTELKTLFLEECGGLLPRFGTRAPRTYAAMLECRGMK